MLGRPDVNNVMGRLGLGPLKVPFEGSQYVVSHSLHRLSHYLIAFILTLLVNLFEVSVVVE